jgi:hypothetical protein
VSVGASVMLAGANLASSVPVLCLVLCQCGVGWGQCRVKCVRWGCCAVWCQVAAAWCQVGVVWGQHGIGWASAVSRVVSVVSGGASLVLGVAMRCQVVPVWCQEGPAWCLWCQPVPEWCLCIAHVSQMSLWLLGEKPRVLHQDPVGSLHQLQLESVGIVLAMANASAEARHMQASSCCQSG